MNGLVKAKINLSRKILADLAVKDMKAFNELVEIAKAQKTKT
jgi:large subunit ribosomal protein L20